MQSFLIGMAVAGIVIGIPLGLMLLLYAFAYLNIFFTFVKEGQAKAIMVGDKFSHFIMSYKGHRLLLPSEKAADLLLSEDKQKYKINRSWDVLIVPEGEEDIGKNDLEKHLNRWGIYWVGIPPFHKVHRRRFTWTSWEQVKNSKGEVEYQAVAHEDEMIDAILIQEDVYYGVIRKAETKENVPFNVRYLLTSGIKNPYSAWFDVHNWLEQVLVLTSKEGKTYVGESLYQELITEENKTPQNTSGAGGTNDRFQIYLGTTIEQLLRDYGVWITNANILELDPANEDAVNFVAASTKQYVAAQQAKAVIELAQAEKKAIELRIEAYNLNPEAARLFVEADTIKEAGTKAGNWVIPNGLFEMFRR